MQDQVESDKASDGNELMNQCLYNERGSGESPG